MRVFAGGVLVTQARSLHQEQQGGEFESYEERRALELETERKSVASVSLLACRALAVVTGVVMLAVGGRRAAQARQETRIRAQPTGLTLRF
ncbi:hypothetical protein [Nannocystis sp. SCPEA4]|uniref:hypothetical protein n=1 Tax=Nannocystis sp. SCPEA4 TaxID=2996787 RepID=UPI00227072BF|nr:hypothetical protein [Nannocystis sp. SCPEA4]MCY1060180.1 hypothetical protein [Nannocystis sp. SCPEA4]